MKLNFSDLCSRKKINKSLDFTLDLKTLEFDNEELKVIEPIRFQGAVEAFDSIINISGNITGTIEVRCSRCLKNFSYPINLDFTEEFTNNLNKEDDSVTLVEDDVINIIEVVVNNVISTLPIKNLCSKNCKGLCQQCGVDLNVHSCTCNTKDVDVRMAKLMDLFK